MELEQTNIPLDFATYLDLHHWTIQNGCFVLAIYKRSFNEREFNYLAEELSKHVRKSPESAFSFMRAWAGEIKSGKAVMPDAGAFLEFMRIYELAASAFKIDEPITPYKFISWAISKRTIIVHDDLIKWREEERDKSPTGRTSAMRIALKNAQSRIAELETALAAKDAELEQARAEMSALREENAALNEELERARQEKGQGNAPEWYGLIAVVEQCRKEGKKPQETAAELKKAGASLAVIGGLLHPNGGISDWRQYGKNLLEGGTKYLPW